MTTASPAAIVAANERFFTAAAGNPPTAEQKDLVAELRRVIVDLGALIEEQVPNGRNKSLALTALEDVQMRANRAIFDPQASRSPATSNNPEGSR